MELRRVVRSNLAAAMASRGIFGFLEIGYFYLAHMSGAESLIIGALSA